MTIEATVAVVHQPSQTDRILDYLKAGRELTRLTALHVFGAANITARISDLRKRGYVIKATMKTDPNGRLYASYTYGGIALPA